MPYRASISRLGIICSCGRSTCCSTLRSAMPSMPEISSFILLPISYMRLRLSPNTLIAILARVPDSIASIRWVIGAPTSTFMPGMASSLWRTSANTSSLLRSVRVNGASISVSLTPKACSSSSARPVFLPTVFISGIDSNCFSTLLPMRSDSARDMPGNVLTLMVNEPSLNGGRKLRPNEANTTNATTNNAAAEPNTTLRLLIAHSNALA